MLISHTHKAKEGGRGLRGLSLGHPGICGGVLSICSNYIQWGPHRTARTCRRRPRSSGTSRRAGRAWRRTRTRRPGVGTGGYAHRICHLGYFGGILGTFACTEHGILGTLAVFLGTFASSGARGFGVVPARRHNPPVPTRVAALAGAAAAAVDQHLRRQDDLRETRVAHNLQPVAEGRSRPKSPARAAARRVVALTPGGRHSVGYMDCHGCCTHSRGASK
jgi:hypothetical protein